MLIFFNIYGSRGLVLKRLVGFKILKKILILQKIVFKIETGTALKLSKTW